MKHFIAFFVAIALSFAALANAGEVTSPVIDGMTLRLGNYVQRVQVRAKSFGPGFCAVTFELGGQSKGVSAPPLTWSNWFDVGPAYIGPQSPTLGFSIGCDTGAIAEVKYLK